MGTPLKNQNFENRASSCFKLAKIKPRAKMSGSWDIFFFLRPRALKKKKKKKPQDPDILALDLILAYLTYDEARFSKF